MPSSKKRRPKALPPVTAIERRRVLLTLEAYERMALLRASDESDYHVGDAAALLGLAGATMYRKMVQRGIPRREPGARNAMRVRAWYLRTKEPVNLATYERLALGRAIREAGGSTLAAGGLLGLSKSTVYRKVRAHGVEAVRR
jgi:transcriptional regulator of acetoin/glycerol metabolism